MKGFVKIKFFKIVLLVFMCCVFLIIIVMNKVMLFFIIKVLKMWDMKVNGFIVIIIIISKVYWFICGVNLKMMIY